MTTETKGIRKHDAFFRWLFADVNHLKTLLELAAKVNQEVYEFLSAVNLDTLARIPDTYSEVDDSGEADLAFRVNVATGAPVLVGVLVEHFGIADVEKALNYFGFTGFLLVAELDGSLDALDDLPCQ